MATPYKAPMSPPPYANDQQNNPHMNMQSPAPAHVNSPPPGSDYYNASPYQQPGYPPQGPPPGQYFDPNQAQQQGYPPQQGYGPQGGYYGQPQQGGYPQQGMYMQPQGQYVDGRNKGSGAKEGFLGACLGALACCCCLDILF